jgi:hypothetical protein
MRLLLSLLLIALPAGVCLADEAAPAPPASQAQTESWQEVYDLSLADGMLLVRNVDIAGQLVDAAVDTGCGELILPQSVAAHLTFDALESLPALDYTGAAQDYPSGFLWTKRLGAQRATYESAISVPDERLGSAAIMPLSHIQADLICFICSAGQLVLCDNDADWGAVEEAEASAGGTMHYIPYWENFGGIFLGVEVGGQRYLALLDTGASQSSVNADFIAAHPALFRATGASAEFTGIHGDGTSEALFELVTSPRLLSIDGQSDLEVAGEVSASPPGASDGQPDGPGDYGGDYLPYLGLAGPNPWPVVMTLGMDVLERYDFAFDTRMKLLMLVER